MKLLILLLMCLVFCLDCSSKMEVIKAELITHNMQNSNNSSHKYLQEAFNFYENERYDSVLVYCHRYYAINSENWELYYLYGKTAFKTGQYNQADRYFIKALYYCKSHQKNRAKIYFALGENEDALGNIKTAKQHYLMVMQLDPDSQLSQTAYKKMQLLSHIN